MKLVEKGGTKCRHMIFVEVFNTLKRRELKYKKIFLVKLTAIEMKGYYDALKHILEWDKDTVIHLF